jgi:hypothetical protein
MSGDPTNPFPPNTLDDLKQRLSDLDTAEALIDKAARAGIDMTEQKKKSADLRAQLLRFRQSFFPGQ